MQLCTNCNGSLLTRRSNIDNSIILEKLRWESGPASVPEPDEVAPILQNAQRDLEEYEQEIHKLESRLSFLTEQRDRLRDTILQTRAVLSPVRKVPDEILRHIFDDRCDTNHFEFNPVSRWKNGSDIPALALSSVCSRWRRVGLAFPNIWARISLKVECYEDHPLQQNTQLLENFSNLLGRSQQWPLSVTINMSEAYVEMTNIECSALFALVREYQRWREFSFYSSSWYLLQKLFLASRISLETFGEFPKLTELALYAPYAHDTTENDADFFAHSVPNLRVFKSHDIPQMPFAFPLAQLLHLKLDPDDMVIEQTGELSRSTRLISLDVTDFVKDLEAVEIDISSIPPITSSTIELLTVRHEFRNGVTSPMRSIFRFLTCPSLNTLHLDSSPSSIQRVDFVQLMEFLKRSSFRLTTLSIKSLSLSDSDLLSLLACTPTLLDLTLDYIECVKSPITSRLINSLHAYHTGSQSPLVPRLQHLYLSTLAWSFEDEVVVEMVKSRWTLGHSVLVDRLRSFTVIFRLGTKVPGTYDALDDIEKEGMRVAVMSYGWPAGFLIVVASAQFRMVNML